MHTPVLDRPARRPGDQPDPGGRGPEPRAAARHPGRRRRRDQAQHLARHRHHPPPGVRAVDPQLRDRDLSRLRLSRSSSPGCPSPAGDAGKASSCRSSSWPMPSAAYIARLSRTFMLEVLQQDYIRTARAKGLQEQLVIGRHALRNILVPLLTSAGIIFGGLLSNTFVVETIFNIPGLGRIAIDSCSPATIPSSWPWSCCSRCSSSLINFAVDVLYALDRSAHPRPHGRLNDAVSSLPSPSQRLPRRARPAAAAALLAPAQRRHRRRDRRAWSSPSRSSDRGWRRIRWTPRTCSIRGARRRRRICLGTDKLGRDILSRLVAGARTSLIVAGAVLAITLAVGTTLGMVAGYVGGRIDAVLMRIVDATLAFPEVVIAILVAAVLGPGRTTVVVSLALVWWPGIARLTRSLVLVLREELFIDAAIVAGTSTPLDLLASPLAEHRRAASGAGLRRRRLHHHGRGDAELPRPRHPGAAGKLGRHDPRRPAGPAQRSLPGAVRQPRARDHDHRLQPARRRPRDALDPRLQGR